MYQVSFNPSRYPLNKIGSRFYLWFKTTALISAVSSGTYTWLISMTPYENTVHAFGFTITFLMNFMVQYVYSLFWNGVIELICFVLFKNIALFKYLWPYMILRSILVGISITYIHSLFWPGFVEQGSLPMYDKLFYGSYIALPLLIYAIVHLWSAWKYPFSGEHV